MKKMGKQRRRKRKKREGRDGRWEGEEEIKEREGMGKI